MRAWACRGRPDHGHLPTGTKSERAGSPCLDEHEDPHCRRFVAPHDPELASGGPREVGRARVKAGLGVGVVPEAHNQHAARGLREQGARESAAALRHLALPGDGAEPRRRVEGHFGQALVVLDVLDEHRRRRRAGHIRGCLRCIRQRRRWTRVAAEVFRIRQPHRDRDRGERLPERSRGPGTHGHPALWQNGPRQCLCALTLRERRGHHGHRLGTQAHVQRHAGEHGRPQSGAAADARRPHRPLVPPCLRPVRVVAVRHTPHRRGAG
mmetsp:Transcript_78458/g.199526  ORF Transcript_78458/g.199526 Transcript_78458/m.199526 type:complete len:267 (-) Transcript_78458:429-1229(-)